MANYVLQERAHWLNLTSLSDRERDKMQDTPIVPEGIFGSALTAPCPSSTVKGARSCCPYSCSMRAEVHRPTSSARLVGTMRLAQLSIHLYDTVCRWVS